MNANHIAGSFGRAALDYDSEAPVQRLIAQKLAELVAVKYGHNGGLGLRVLEIGCGTGFLTQALMAKLPKASWTVSDISAEMLEKCKERVGKKSARFILMDGQNPRFDQPVNLVVSSLAFQWFSDLKQSLNNLYDLIEKDGKVYFSTLGVDTFQEWRHAHEKLGLDCGLHHYPDAKSLLKILPKLATGQVNEQSMVYDYDHAMDFLKALKTIGAQTPHAGHRPLSPGQLKKVIAEVETSQEVGCPITYHVLYGQFRKHD